jgi:hypothetical protein
MAHTLDQHPVDFDRLDIHDHRGADRFVGYSGVVADSRYGRACP